MELDGNNEVDDESCGLYASEDNNESDSDFDYNNLADSLDELRVLEEDSDTNEEEMNSMNESHAVD
ncbi:unnamed protein product, partial [Rotaria sordida]